MRIGFAGALNEQLGVGFFHLRANVVSEDGARAALEHTEQR